MGNGIGSDWTVNTLYTHLSCMLAQMEKRLDERLENQHEATMRAFDDAEKATNTAMASAKEAVDKAEKLATERSDQQNEWRATVEDLTKTRVPRIEYEMAHKVLEARLRNIEKRDEGTAGAKVGSSTTIAWVVAAMSVFIGTFSVLWKLFG